MSETEPTDPVASAPAETPPLPEPEPTPPPPRAPVAEPPPPRRRGGWAFRVIATLLFLLLAAAVGWLWNQQQMLAQQLAAQHLPADQSAQVADLQQKLDGLRQQLTALQNRPAPPAPAAAPAAAPVDLKPLEDRLAALEQRGTQAPPPPAPPPVDLGPLTQKLEAVAAEAAAAKGAEADLNKELTSKLADLAQRLATAEQQASQFGSKAAQAQRIEQAQVALESGSPLGTIPNAPPAVTRFADTAPPTEASLRLSFPAAAAAAERASSPSVAGKSLGERMWLRARSLVTVKQGDEVLVGAPAAKVLGVAQMRLDAGDLAGAVKALDELDGPAAQAMAPWRQQAQALLDARAALSRMAGA